MLQSICHIHLHYTDTRMYCVGFKRQETVGSKHLMFLCEEDGPAPKM